MSGSEEQNAAFAAPLPRVLRKPSLHEESSQTPQQQLSDSKEYEVNLHDNAQEDHKTNQPQPKSTPSPDVVGYESPSWGTVPDVPFQLEVIKNGVSAEMIDLKGKDHFTMGRSLNVDIPMEHPSISRLHAVIQFQKKNFPYLYDNGSTHGTVVNKKPILPRKYFPLKNGDVIKFGQSTRLYIFIGYEEEPQEESEQQQQHSQRKATPAIETEVTWGMGEDATPYESDEENEQEFSGREEDLEAFAQAQKKASKKKADDEDSDSDDDDFYDRTGKKSKKQLQKEMKEKKPEKVQVETVETLEAKIVVVEEKRKELKGKLPTLLQSMSASSEDSLDEYMQSLSTKMAIDSYQAINVELKELDAEEARLRRLLKIAQPVIAGFFSKPTRADESSTKPGAVINHAGKEPAPRIEKTNELKTNISDLPKITETKPAVATQARQISSDHNEKAKKEIEEAKPSVEVESVAEVAANNTGVHEKEFTPPKFTKPSTKGPTKASKIYCKGCTYPKKHILDMS
eukprot:TRINITY_DN2975_c0_g1_i3.p1 TRINITY_DN2975_c0_g1~~TRINITY_DN2975_c0_g1_i3.p1  ORF type:complete len:513 (+),score=132.55 TRINITY_DN2975_c0_g1_i3:54-1592(+)